MTIVQERAKHWTNVFAKDYYGDTVENLIVKEREKEREKEQERLEKERENTYKLVIKLHFDKKWTIDTIADLLELPTTHIRKIIKQYKAEKNVKA